MSYRAFKRLLGETSLERKCRFLFGAFILLLITASFWLYAYQTEHLAYDQTRTAGRRLVMPIFAKKHLPLVSAYKRNQLQKALDELGKKAHQPNAAPELLEKEKKLRATLAAVEELVQK